MDDVHMDTIYICVKEGFRFFNFQRYAQNCFMISGMCLIVNNFCFQIKNFHSHH